MLLCRVRCVSFLARSSCTISMQKFEVGEMFNVGRPAIFVLPTNCDFLSDKETFLKIQTMIKSRYNESSSFSDNLMKRQSFHAWRGRAKTDFRQGLSVENNTTNRLLSLII